MQVESADRPRRECAGRTPPSAIWARWRRRFSLAASIKSPRFPPAPNPACDSKRPPGKLPGSANRAPRLRQWRNKRCITTGPPWPCSSITSSPVNECGAGKAAINRYPAAGRRHPGKSVNTATRRAPYPPLSARHRQQSLTGQTNHANPAATGRGGNGGQWWANEQRT